MNIHEQTVYRNLNITNCTISHTYKCTHTHRELSTISEKACFLLDLVERRGSKAYRQFVKVLDESEVDFPIGQLLRNDENHGMCMHLASLTSRWAGGRESSLSTVLFWPVT